MAESRNNYQINNTASYEPQANAFQMISYAPMVVQGGIKFGKCTHNHAASIGRHATDGCNQFLNGTNDPFFCAVCGCHQNFHQQELPRRRRLRATLPLLAPPPPPTPEPLILPPIAVAPINALVGGEGPSVMIRGKNGVGSEMKRGEGVEMEGQNKAKRTRFTVAQKIKMTRFAEKLGWRSQRHDKEEIDRFCEEVGISLRSFKVWLSNNRHRRDVV